MNSLQREEELKQLCQLIAAESRELRRAVREDNYNHVAAIFGCLRIQIDEYFMKQEEPAR